MPAKQEMLVQFLGREDPLEKGMATHSNILAWETPWMEEPGRVAKSDGARQRLSTSTLDGLGREGDIRTWPWKRTRERQEPKELRDLLIKEPAPTDWAGPPGSGRHG